LLGPVAIQGLFSKTVPDWTVLVGLVILLATLPAILVLKSSSLACATAKAVVADMKHPDNQLTVNKGTIIKVTVPKDAVPFASFAQVASRNTAVVAVDQTPCGWPQGDEATVFDFRAVAEGSGQLYTVGPNPASAFTYGWTPVAWDVTVVGPDYGPLLIVGIELSIAALAGAFILYRRRQGRLRSGTSP
jgi:hypothetical protein